jgi:hypothetical protein
LAGGILDSSGVEGMYTSSSLFQILHIVILVNVLAQFKAYAQSERKEVDGKLLGDRYQGVHSDSIPTASLG